MEKSQKVVCNSNMLKCETELINKNLAEREKELLRLLFAEKVDSSDIQHLTSDLDIDNEKPDYLLMLARLGNKFGWQIFNKKHSPRLQGIHRYYHFKFVSMLPWFCEQLGVFNDNNIDVLLLKGIAMTTYYASGKTRLMSDFDIAIKDEDYDRATEVMRSREDFIETTQPHSVTYSMKKAGPSNSNLEMDIHRWIFKFDNGSKSDMWKNIIPVDFYGKHAFVLSPMDMFIHQFNNQAGNIFRNEMPDRRLQWLYDCRCILETGRRDGCPFTAADIYKRASELKCVYSVQLIGKIFIDCFPGVIDKDEFERYFADSEDYERWIAFGKRQARAIEKHDELVYVKKSKNFIRKYTLLLRYYWARYKFAKLENKDFPLTFFQLITLTSRKSNIFEVFVKCIKNILGRN